MANKELLFNITPTCTNDENRVFLILPGIIMNSTKPNKQLFFCLITINLLLFGLYGESWSTPEPEILSRAAILYDLTTDSLLYEKNADEEIPPASMTKLMSLHLAYQAISEGRITKDTLVPITREASFKSSPPHSSLMFLEEGQRVTLLDLMIGLALPSGNDAGIALAQAITGDMDSFVAAMNEECERLGLTRTHFVDSFGYSEDNLTTARDFAEFCKIYLTEHPESLEELHALTEYTYPRPENIPPGAESAYGPITQYNHNSLVGALPGVDGLKTGFIDESGYNIALTAERQGRRLLAVLMGGAGENGRGNINRAIDATQLITWGYTAYTTVPPDLPDLPKARVWKGMEKQVSLSVEAGPVLTLPRGEAAGLEFEIHVAARLIAPLPAGTPAGSLVCKNSLGKTLYERPITTAAEVPRGSFFRRLLDTIALFFLGDK